MAAPQLVAAIPDYQLRRLIAYETSCVIEEVTFVDKGPNGLEYHVLCENVSFYPDGVHLRCPDRDAIEHRRLDAVERRFDVMESLRDQVDSGT